MTPERLQEVEEIYHAVLKVPPVQREQFLHDSCGGDVDLRLEVESLLSFEDAFDNVIDLSPQSLIKEIFIEPPNLDIIGTQINQYKIVSLLGQGGMGTVFLAHDTKLERKVAVKFLSEEFIRDGINLQRFFLEAKSASALNHPNIITVYEIGEFENRPFIATEFIDGVTLKKYLLEKQPALGVILELAVQI